MFPRKTLYWLGLSLCLANPSYAREPKLGELPKPPSRIEYLDGAALRLEALRGKPAVLYFGADWCEPCRNQGRPTMIAVANKHKAKGLQVVFISLDDNTVRAAKTKESKTLGIPIAMAKLDICPPGRCQDGLREQGEFGRLHKIPTAVVLDSSGVVRAILEGGRGVQEGLDKAVERTFAP